MTTVHQVERADLENAARADALQPVRRRIVAFTKGSVDGLLEISSHVWVNGQVEMLDEDWRRRIEAANEKLAAKGHARSGGGLPGAGVQSPAVR